MPTYELQCRRCTHEFERSCPHALMLHAPCPSCGSQDIVQVFRTPPMTERQFIGDERSRSITEGFHPAEVETARRLYPGHDIRDNGDVHFTTRSKAKDFQRKKAAIKKQSL